MIFLEDIIGNDTDYAGIYRARFIPSLQICQYLFAINEKHCNMQINFSHNGPEKIDKRNKTMSELVPPVFWPIS